MPTRNVDLTEHHDKYIAAAIEGGRYNNASKVMREGLRLLEQRDHEDQAKVEWLRGVTDEAMTSLKRGEGRSFPSMTDLTDHLRALRAERVTAGA